MPEAPLRLIKEVEMEHSSVMQPAGRGTALQGLQAPRQSRPHMSRALCVRPSALFGKKKAQERQMTRKEPPKAPRKQQSVEYGKDWYESTRAAPTRTTREELGAAGAGTATGRQGSRRWQAGEQARPAASHSPAAPFVPLLQSSGGRRTRRPTTARSARTSTPTTGTVRSTRGRASTC